MGWCELCNEITSLDLAAVYPKFILACFTTSEGLSGYRLYCFVANRRRPFMARSSSRGTLSNR